MMNQSISFFIFYPHMKNETQIALPNKGKAIPLQAWTVPEGSRRMRLPDFKTIGT